MRIVSECHINEKMTQIGTKITLNETTILIDSSSVILEITHISETTGNYQKFCVVLYLNVFSMLLQYFNPHETTPVISKLAKS